MVRVPGFRFPVSGLFVVLLFVSSVIIGCGSETNAPNTDTLPITNSSSGKRVAIGTTNYTIELIPGYYIEKQEDPNFEVYYFKPDDTTNTVDEAGIYFGPRPDTSAPSSEYTRKTYPGTFMGNSVTWTEFVTATYTQREVYIDNGPDAKIHCWCYSADPAVLEKLYVMIKTIR